MSKYTTITLVAITLVESFKVADVEDPDHVIAFELERILDSELGQWLDSIGSEVYTHSHVDPDTFGYRVKITARMSEQNALYYKLKWK